MIDRESDDLANLNFGELVFDDELRDPTAK
jgi:hypothetical protein